MDNEMIPVKTDTFWTVWVEGREGGRVCHKSPEEARKEALRLASLSDNVGKRVFILRATEFFQARIEMSHCATGAELLTVESSRP